MARFIGDEDFIVLCVKGESIGMMARRKCLGDLQCFRTDLKEFVDSGCCCKDGIFFRDRNHSMDFGYLVDFFYDISVNKAKDQKGAVSQVSDEKSTLFWIDCDVIEARGFPGKGDVANFQKGVAGRGCGLSACWRLEDGQGQKKNEGKTTGAFFLVRDDFSAHSALLLKNRRNLRKAELHHRFSGYDGQSSGRKSSRCPRESPLAQVFMGRKTPL